MLQIDGSDGPKLAIRIWRKVGVEGHNTREGMMRHSEQINELAAALVAASAEMPAVKKTAINPHFHSKFAPLEEIDATVRPVLAKHDLVIVQGGEPTGTCKTQVSTMLLHKSGQWIEATAEATPSKDDPQGVVAVFTYLRRAGYAIAGIVADGDDDGTSASQKPIAKPAMKPEATHEPKNEVTRVPLNDKGQEVQTITLVYDKVGQKSGEGKKGPWTRYYVKGSDGKFYSSFDETVGAALDQLIGQNVELEYRVDVGPKGENRTITNIVAAGIDSAPVTKKDDLPF